MPRFAPVPAITAPLTLNPGSMDPRPPKTRQNAAASQMNHTNQTDMFTPNENDQRPYIVAWEEVCGPKYGRCTDNPTTKAKAEELARELNEFKPSIRHWAEPV